MYYIIIYISNTLAGFWQIRISSKIRTGWQKWEGTSGAWGKIWPMGLSHFWSYRTQEIYSECKCM